MNVKAKEDEFPTNFWIINLLSFVKFLKFSKHDVVISYLRNPTIKIFVKMRRG
jgi:hypothetical protein